MADDQDLAGISRLLVQIERDSRNASANASQQEKENALKVCTAEIDRIFRFKGHKAKPDQALSWPRVGVTDKNGGSVIGLPPALKNAVAFLAGAYVAGYRIGPENLDHSRALVANVMLMLDGLLDPEEPTQKDMLTH